MWPFKRKDPPCTAEQAARIWVECQQRSADEDALLEEYWALPDRPKVMRMMRDHEGSEPELTDIMDLDDFLRWAEPRRKVRSFVDALRA